MPLAVSKSAIASVMNRWCVAEMGLLVAGGRAREALRRLRPSLTVGIGEASIAVTYPSWPKLKRALEPEFRTLSVEALTLLLLPYAWPALADHGRIYQVLCRLDRALAQRRPFASLGDHLLVVAERSLGPESRGLTLKPWASTRKAMAFPNTNEP